MILKLNPQYERYDLENVYTARQSLSIDITQGHCTWNSLGVFSPLLMGKCYNSLVCLPSARASTLERRVVFGFAVHLGPPATRVYSNAEGHAARPARRAPLALCEAPVRRPIAPHSPVAAHRGTAGLIHLSLQRLRELPPAMSQPRVTGSRAGGNSLLRSSPPVLQGGSSRSRLQSAPAHRD